MGMHSGAVELQTCTRAEAKGSKRNSERESRQTTRQPQSYL